MVEEIKTENVEKVEEKLVETEEKVETEKTEKKKKEISKEKKPELEREYVVPLRANFLKVPKYRRAKRAVRTIKVFLAKHMKVANRDLRLVKINIHLNNEVWFRGIKKPMSKIKVKAKKIDGVVYAELADVPEIVKFKIAREVKREANVKTVKKPKHDEKKVEGDKDHDGIQDKAEEAEDRKSTVEAGLEKQKSSAKSEKHTTKGSHAKKTMPVRQSLKK